MNEFLSALRAAAEPTRLRLLFVLSRAELTVTELTRVLDQSQPRVSRHLKLLCEAGLLDRIQEGAWVFHRLASRGPGARLARALLELMPEDDPLLALDLDRLAAIERAHAEEAARYFRENAWRWDAIRALYAPDSEVEEALLEVVGPEPVEDHLDLGTGTAWVLKVLAPRVRRGLGIDSSREMLAVARARLEAEGLRHCQVRLGDIYRLRQPAACADLVTIHHVLHYLDEPATAVAEAVRTLRPGGRLLIVDFAPHELEFLRTEYAHRRLGFDDAEVEGWLRAAGLVDVEMRRLEGESDAGGPALTVCLWSGVQGAEVGPRRCAVA